MSDAPLEDPEYKPLYPPVDGKIPEEVSKFGPLTQIRWFMRFRKELDWTQDVSSYYVFSEEHRGTCCYSCHDELYEDRGVIMDGYCCCHDNRIRKGNKK